MDEAQWIVITLVSCVILAYTGGYLIGTVQPQGAVDCDEPCEFCCNTYTDNNVVSFHCTEAGEPLKIGEARQ